MPDDAMRAAVQTKSGSISRPLSPEEQVLHGKIGLLVQKAGRFLEENQVGAADSAAREAIKLSAGLSGGWSHYQRGSALGELQVRIFFRQNKYEDAAALYGFRADPYGNLNLNAAIAFVKTGRIAEAKKAWNTNYFLVYHDYSEPYLPGERTAHDWEATLFLARGMVDFDERRYGSAAWALERAVRIAPHNPVALWYYGKALAENNRLAEARSLYQAAIRYDKSGPIARYARHDLQQLGARR